MAAIGKVSLDGIYKEDAQYGVNISGTINLTTDIGKALSIDATAANTLKLAADGDNIIGRLEVYEDRTQEGIKVGTANTDGGMKFPIGASETVAVGDFIVGDGNGFVRKAVTATATELKRWLVMELKTVAGVQYAVAIKI